VLFDPMVSRYIWYGSGGVDTGKLKCYKERWTSKLVTSFLEGGKNGGRPKPGAIKGWTGLRGKRGFPPGSAGVAILVR
jgi:hypothetical protein